MNIIVNNFMILIFYIFIFLIIIYSKGRMPVGRFKRDSYMAWVNTYGKIVFKYTIRLFVLYTILLILTKINL